MNGSEPYDVWIDTDVAIGVPGADVDDGLALVQAFHSSELRLRGVSSVYGNAPIESTHSIAVDVVRRFGPPHLDVYRGAGSALERTEPSEAIEGLAAALEEAPLHVMALGPVTNVSGLLERHPALESRILSIVMVAARRPGQSFVSQPRQPTPFPDLNFDCDPVAMSVLLNTRIPLVFTPWEVSSHVWIDAEDLRRLAADGGESGAWVAEHSRPWLDLWRGSMGAKGFNPFDTLAIAWLTHPELLEHFRCRVWIEDGLDDTAPLNKQRAGAMKPHLLVDDARQGDGREAVYCFRTRDGFKQLLLERLSDPQR